MDSIRISSIPKMRLTQRHSLNSNDAEGNDGSLHLTPHHLIFKSSRDELWISQSILSSVTRSAGTNHSVTLRTRDFKVYDLLFDKSDEATAVYDSLKLLCTGVSKGGLDSLYAFNNQSSSDVKGKGKASWNIYDPVEEFARMGVGSRSKAWRCSTINLDYEFCPSYPATIMVPSKISDTTLGYAVKYRSKGRIPGLVYLHWANLGSITRSSQPMVGLKNARSIQDEKLIESIFTSHSQHSTATPPSRHPFSLPSASSSANALDAQGGQVVYGATATNLIIDARPTTNAMANSVKGAGTENMEHYRNCKKAYLGIDNIHVMRSSLAAVDEALRESEVTGQVDRTALRRTNWLKHLTNFLDGILVITRTIHLSNSHVLVHCSDGWDRTSQLSSLAQLCLDPFYRTAHGLAVLIEKDWISYGHRFADRTGHLCGDRTEFTVQSADPISAQSSFIASVQKQFSGSSHAFKETCPVFQQFLDAIYQIQRQFPERFEWNESLLRRLQKETYAGTSGTFLWNSERQREEMKGKERTRSIWEDIFRDEEGRGELVLKQEFRNDAYRPALDDPDSRADDADQGVLLVEPSNVRWWYELFGRDDDEMNGRIEVLNEEVDDVAVIIEGVEGDPIISPTAFQSSSTEIPVSRMPPVPSRSESAFDSRSDSPTPRTPSSLASATSNLPSQVQLAEAVSSVQKFGWSAWKSVQKNYQEAVTTYRESAPLPSSSSSSSSRSLAPASPRSSQRSSLGLDLSSSSSRPDRGAYDSSRSSLPPPPAITNLWETEVTTPQSIIPFPLPAFPPTVISPFEVVHAPVVTPRIDSPPRLVSESQDVDPLGVGFT